MSSVKIQDKVCLVCAQYGTRLLPSKYGTNPYFTERMATLAVSILLLVHDGFYFMSRRREALSCLICFNEARKERIQHLECRWWLYGSLHRYTSSFMAQGWLGANSTQCLCKSLSSLNNLHRGSQFRSKNIEMANSLHTDSPLQLSKKVFWRVLLFLCVLPLQNCTKVTERVLLFFFLPKHAPQVDSWLAVSDLTVRSQLLAGWSHLQQPNSSFLEAVPFLSWKLAQT